PIEEMEIAPLVYELASESEKSILREEYDVIPFSIMTITMERIFVDKLFAAEAYARRANEKEKALEVAKHIYDLTIMSHTPKIEKLLIDDTQLLKLLDIRIEEETARLDGIPGVLPTEFTFFDIVCSSEKIQSAYSEMQLRYVFRQEDRMKYETVVETLLDIRKRLEQNSAWRDYHKA
ncbi:MAG: hypothetical protein J5622_04825, partial [Firmicutes bacterium]|nr:hypothetical protein [Bacillota bacterium]